MRIIAGEFRHRKLHTPKDGSVTRPIPDRVKESLFSLLRGWTEGAVVLDAFAGTGAIGLEAISRGASRCVFIERDKRIGELLRRNVEELGCDERAEIVLGDSLGATLLSRCPKPVDLIFFDPPYPLVNDSSVDQGGEGGWERVKLQFSRVIQYLNTTNGGGYAVLRTPWPFRHRVDGADTDGANSEAGSVDTERGAKGKRGRKGDGEGRRSVRERDDRRRSSRPKWEEEEDEVAWEGEELAELLDGSEEGDGDGVEEFYEEGDEGEGGGGGKFVMVDLAIPGAVGPETHVYGNTAVHLYMKKA